MTPALPILIDCIKDAIDDQRKITNRHFFAQRFVSYGDARAIEQALRAALAILEPHVKPDPLPACDALGLDHGSEQEAA